MWTIKCDYRIQRQRNKRVYLYVYIYDAINNKWSTITLNLTKYEGGKKAKKNREKKKRNDSKFVWFYAAYKQDEVSYQGSLCTQPWASCVYK